uniref:Ras-related protein Rab-18 n=1 Tax=Heterorhabditis bacteriophora TaxID=37862 RepID=A0A1I7XTG1_HETBA
MLAASIKDVKVVIIGDSGVGKSAILKRFFHNIFYEEDQATIGIDFLHKVVKLNDDTAVRLQLWDTAGQERFRQLAPSYIRDAVVALLVFDLTRQHIPCSTKLFESKRSKIFLEPNILEQIARWTLFVERERGKETKVFLVGNKCDLKNKRFFIINN